MSITIYFDSRPLLITEEQTEFAKQVIRYPNTLVIQKGEALKVESILHSLEEGTVDAVIVYTDRIETVFESFKSQMKLIRAGGGLVHTTQNEILLIFRKKKWDLPKGKLDSGETIEQAALREVEEETGLKALSLEQFLMKTYHTYREKGKLILKESHWYLMKSGKEEALIPQAEEDIEICEWVNLDNLQSYMSNTHPSVGDVLTLGRKTLPATRETK